MGFRTVGENGVCNDGDNAGMVDKLIGTSYDVVKKVAYNLPFLEALAQLVDSGGTLPDGEQGPKGEDGIDGTNGIDGQDGEDGKSAYEVAVINGFVGTESEWLASLKGDSVLTKGVNAISSYGPTTPPTLAAATILAASEDAGKGGPVLVDRDILLPNNAQALQLEYLGAKAVYSLSTALTSRNVGTGFRVSNLNGRWNSLFAWGLEYLGPAFYHKLENGLPVKIGLVGDSNMEYNFGIEFVENLRSLPNVTVQNCAHSGTTQRQSIDNSGAISGTGHRWSSIIDAEYDLIIDGYGGTNDPSFGGTVASFEADKREAYNMLRAKRSMQETAVVLLTANMQNDGVDGRDELFSHRARTAIQQICKDYGFAFLDKQGRFPDAFADVADLGARNTNLDEYRVHTSVWLSKALAWAIFEDMIPAQYRTASRVTTFTGAHTLMYGVNPPKLYPRGVSILRTGDGGFPLDGFVLTFVDASGFALQMNYGYNGQTTISVRTGNNFDAWGNWFSLGGSGSASTQYITPAAGYSFAGVPDLKKMAATLTGGATLLKGTITKTTPGPVGFGDSIGSMPVSLAPDETFTITAKGFIGSTSEDIQIQLGDDGSMLVTAGGASGGNIDKIVISQVIFRN